MRARADIRGARTGTSPRWAAAISRLSRVGNSHAVEICMIDIDVRQVDNPSRAAPAVITQRRPGLGHHGVGAGTAPARGAGPHCERRIVDDSNASAAPVPLPNRAPEKALPDHLTTGA
jgi:hypothetical protein